MLPPELEQALTSLARSTRRPGRPEIIKDTFVVG
jgi:hypothetical protein